MKRSAPISFLLQLKAGPGLAPPENSQLRVPTTGGGGGGYGLPAGSGSENEACSGQTPLSSTPTTTPSPALAWPPSSRQSAGAFRNCGLLSVVGWSSVSG